MIVRADLHNHSCLSPCASLEMSPSRIAAAARAGGVRILGLTDHNAAFNCPAFAVACARESLLPFFGMELNPREEAHLLVLFAAPRQALQFARSLDPLLPDIPLRPEVLGDEVVVDADENVLGLYGRWLGAALDTSFDELASLAAKAGALVIPAHVDRPAMSVYSQLGFLPEGPYDAVESIGRLPAALCGDHAVISGSDAHYPEHVARRSFEIDLPDDSLFEFQEQLKAFFCSAGLCAGALPATPSPEDSAARSLWDELLGLPILSLYPEKAALDFMEIFRKALREKRVKPTHVSRPLVS
ncbi:MAG: PHP domain-containing protein [Spirochaetaceae bacterium]|nr:PHP domain-containing protein [Spirochaetaceae bacterium]